MDNITSYREIVGDDALSAIYRKARKLYGKHILHLNSTYQGGGVAEILVSFLPLANDAGINMGWRILHGHPDFFNITKKFHNALQGDDINLTNRKKELYLQANRDFSVYTHINHDCVIIHDPQPLPLITFYKKKQPWIWRCHVDLSAPDPEVWDYLKQFIIKYDFVIVSNEGYVKEDLPVEQRIIYPAIDPISLKNKGLSDSDISKYLKKFNVPTDKPLMTQVSRFDKYKDPEGVLRVFKRVKEDVDCRLVLCGSMASDDPEGLRMYGKIERAAKKFVDNKEVILITVENDILVNVLQRSSAVVVQKSTREGFGLTVTEALWKGKSVVASNVGGIPLQIEDGVSGFLVDPDDEEGFAERIIEVLKNPALGEELGAKGKKTVKDKFLITRLVSDYLNVLNELLG
jgi:trehalose synthase